MHSCVCVSGRGRMCVCFSVWSGVAEAFPSRRAAPMVKKARSAKNNKSAKKKERKRKLWEKREPSVQRFRHVSTCVLHHPQLFVQASGRVQLVRFS